MGSRRLTEEDVNLRLESRGIVVIEYAGHSKLKSKFRCRSGHVWETKANTVLNGHGCPQCYAEEKRAKVTEWPNGVECLNYAGAVSGKSTFRCKCGFVWSATGSDVLRGKSHCPNCSTNRKRLEIGEIEERLRGTGFELVSYSGDICRVPSTLRCQKGHEWAATLGNIFQGRGCPRCASFGRSKVEDEVCEFLDSMGVGYRRNDRSLIHPREIDILIPQHNLAIEINGLYWHSEAAGKGRKYHMEKRVAVEARGFRLLSIRDELWLHKKEIIKKIISHSVGISSLRVFARKCHVKEINKLHAEYFLEENHIQGFRNSTKYISLVYEEKIVAVMTLTCRKGEWELVRYATSCSVVGGLSKLWAYAVRCYGITDGFTYTDRDLFTGESYLSAGFKKASVRCGFRIVVNNATKTESRQKWNKAPEGMTQSEWYAAQGVSRIWDSGQEKLVWNR